MLKMLRRTVCGFMIFSLFITCACTAQPSVSPFTFLPSATPRIAPGMTASLPIKNPVKTRDPSRPVIALTFDDGPDPNTDKVLDALQRHNAVATFFVIGNLLQKHPNTTKRIVQAGCEIGNHTWDHQLMRNMTAKEIRENLHKTQDAVFSLTGSRPKLMRPTFGSVSDSMKAAIDMPIALWTLDTEDWKLRDAQKITDFIVSKAKDGDVVLMHDIHYFTAEATEQILTQLEEKGFQFLTYSQLLEHRGITAEAGKIYR